MQVVAIYLCIYKKWSPWDCVIMLRDIQKFKPLLQIKKLFKPIDFDPVKHVLVSHPSTLVLVELILIDQWIIKEEHKKFLKNRWLTSYAITMDQITFVSTINFFSEKNVSFIYSIVTLFSKITYATFKVRAFKSLFYKISTFLLKATTFTGLQAEKIFSVNIGYTYFFNFGRVFCGSFSILIQKSLASCGKKMMESQTHF